MTFFNKIFLRFLLAYLKVVSNKILAKNICNLLNYDIVYVAIKNRTDAIDPFGTHGVRATNFYSNFDLFFSLRPYRGPKKKDI
jgi:hypothetical protein